MDPYAYISPDPVMAPDMFGDDQQDMTPMTFPADFFLGDMNDSSMLLSDAFSLPAADPNDPFNTPPLSGFDGYLAGNIDFDDTLLPNDLSWAAECYNQDFNMIDGFNSNIPPPPSTASESQGLSPIDNMYLPYTPPEIPDYSPLMIAPFPSDNFAVPEPQTPTPPQNENNTTNSHPLGPKRELRKLIKPETCPVCGKGHAQLRERDRHIITKHYDDAVRMGLNVDRAQCSLCEQSFRRKDHLTRHMKRRHGW